METVGVFLRKEREAKNISLSEVSRQTKISKFYLDYIENDDYEKLPQGPYIKGYISSYSKLIGTDVEEALKLYDSLKNKGKPTETKLPAPPSQKAKGAQPKKTTLNPANRPTAGLARKLSASFNTAAAAIKAKSASLKAATPPLNDLLKPIKKFPASFSSGGQKLKSSAARASEQINSKLEGAGSAVSAIGPWTKKTMGPFVQNTASALKAIGPLPKKRFWLFGGASLAGTCILILAGFGVYHLFFFDKHSPVIAQPQALPNKKPAQQLVLKKPSPSSSMTVITERLPSIPKNAFASTQTSGEPDRQTNVEQIPLTSAPKEKVAQPSSVDQEKANPDGQKKIMASAPTQPQDDAAEVSLSVLKASVSTGVENRIPVGVDTTFPASTQRVYVWSQIEAKQFPTKIRHVYYFNGWKANEITLDVRSSSWRTWSFKTISNDRYKGPWRVDITSEAGKILRRLHFEIK